MVSAGMEVTLVPHSINRLKLPNVTFVEFDDRIAHLNFGYATLRGISNAIAQ